MNSKESILFTLNETAAYILHCIQRGKSSSDIVNLVRKKYDIDAAQAKKDVNSTINRMKKNEIIVSNNS